MVFIMLGCWLLSPNICHWSGAIHVRGNRGPKLPKRDFVSSGWHHRRNRCGRLVEEASVNNTNDSLDVRYGKKIKNTIK